MVRKSTVRIPISGRGLNWHKEDSQKIRRQNALKNRKGDLLGAGRALQALANLSQDSDTVKKSRSDAVYFFAQHKKKQALKTKTRRK